VPYTITFDDIRGGVIATFSGDITSEEVFSSVIDRFEGIQGNSAIRYSVGDYTNVSSLTLSTSNIQALAARVREVMRQQQDLIAAIVAPSDIAFGLGRMVELYADQAEAFTVFRTMAEAEAWIAETLRTPGAPV
jgi:hypothetical protein